VKQTTGKKGAGSPRGKHESKQHNQFVKGSVHPRNFLKKEREGDMELKGEGGPGRHKASALEKRYATPGTSFGGGGEFIKPGNKGRGSPKSRHLGGVFKGFTVFVYGCSVSICP